MNKKIKKKWVKALRSGEYVQGRQYLCVPKGEYDEFCCLGVLCDLIARDKDSKSPSWRRKRVFRYMADDLIVLAFGYKHDTPTEAFRRKVGLDKDEQDELIEMNDNQNRSFKEIADYIEVNL